jgi:hypothetical protein
MTSITVTAAQGGAGAHAGTILAVKVLTGQAASPIGVAAQAAALEAAITPGATGSIIYGACADNADDVSLTAASGTTIISQVNGAGISAAVVRKTATTTGGTGATVGTTSGFPNVPSCALLEILSGTGLVEDSSTPAVASSATATSVTSASFSPPAGAILVALVGAGNSVSGQTTVTVTDSSGLTWTQRSVKDPSGAAHASVWTAELATPVSVSLPALTLALAAPAVTPQAFAGVGVSLPVLQLALAAPVALPSRGTVSVSLPALAVALAAPAPVPRAIAAFPRDPIGLSVEILVGTTWTDITSLVYERDPVVLTRGRADESAFTNPSTCTMTWNNRDGRFSYMNPSGMWYGMIGRNTQVRVSVQAANPDDGSRSRRYWGELAEVPFSWDPSDTDRWVQVQVGGILRRLSQNGALGTSPANLDLPFTAFIASLAGTSLAPVAWWPCTDAASATQFASGVAGGPAMAFSGTPSLAASTAFPGSGAVPAFGKSSWTGLLNGATSTAGGTTLVTDTFFSSGPWTCPPRVTSLGLVKSTGSGGGGSGGAGGGSPHGGSGGGAGGITIKANVAVTPGNIYDYVVGGDGNAGAPNNGAGGDGGDTSFPGDSETVTGGGGSGAPSDTSAGSGGSGDFPGGDGTPGVTGGGGGGGGAGGGPGTSGLGSNGGGNGGAGGGSGQSGGNGNAPGGGGGGAGAGSTTFGGFGAFGELVLQYLQPGEGSVNVGGGPQNANVLRFLLGIPAAGDADGAEVARLYTSGTAAILQVFYHQGIAILSAALSTSGAITSIPVNPIPEPIPSGHLITVAGSDGSQTFTTSAAASTGATALTVTSATVTITTAAGGVITRAGDLPGYLQLFGLDAAESRLWDTGLQPFGADGRPMLVSVELAQAGTAMDWTFQTLLAGAQVPVAVTGSVAAATVGSAGALLANPFSELDGTAAGQFILQYATSDITTLAGPLAAWAGEAAGDRFARLCVQEGIAYEITGDPGATVLMGAQQSDTFVNLLQSCEVADRGQVYEPRDLLGLGYRTRASMQSQPPRFALDYSSKVLPSAPPLLPAQDDQYTANIIVATRQNGGTLTASLGTGRLSVQPPPGGVGPYQAPVTASLFSDTQLPDFAGWLLNLGTADDYRFPVIPLRMERMQVTDLGLWPAICAADIGDYLQITSPPSWLRADDIRQICLGITETITNYSWVIAYNCVPEKPYEVLVAGDEVLGRADTDGSQVDTGFDETATTFDVASTVPGAPLWTTDTAQFPFDIGISGERMTVTGITGTSSPQSFTVTRSVNGVAKAHLAGEPVNLFTRPVFGM